MDWNNRMANMFDIHTCTTCHVDVIAPLVLVTDRELLQLAGAMISGPSVSIPIGVNTIGSNNSN